MAPKSHSKELLGRRSNLARPCELQTLYYEKTDKVGGQTLQRLKDFSNCARAASTPEPSLLTFGLGDKF